MELNIFFYLPNFIRRVYKGLLNKKIIERAIAQSF